MNTSANIHRPPIVVVATSVAGLVLALLAAAGASAQAIPDRMDAPAGVDGTGQSANRDVERPCFIVPLSWNEAIDGPLPRCHTYVSRRG